MTAAKRNPMPAMHPLVMSGVQRASHAVLPFISPSTNRAKHSIVAPPPVTLFSDGSLLPVGAGAAVYVQFPGAPAITAKLHLGENSQYKSTQAEYWAALLALQLLNKILSLGYPGRTYRLASDFRGVHDCLCITKGTPSSGGDNIIVMLQHYMKRIRKAYPDVEIKAVHTPRGNTEGNRRADRAARIVARDPGTTGVDLLD